MVKPESVELQAAALSVPKHVLLHCVAGKTEQTRAGTTGTVTSKRRSSPTALNAEARSELLLMLLMFLTAAAVAICRRGATTG
jgi:hypothetical protein